MDNPMSMQMLQSLRSLSRNSSDLALAHQVSSHNIRQRPSLHVLHHHPKLILMQERVNIIDNVRVTRRAHNKDLVDNEVLLRLLLEVHLFYGNREIGADLVGSVDASGSTREIRYVNEREFLFQLGKLKNTHPAPILTKLRYSFVGSAGVHIACKRFTMSASLSLSPFFLLGVATPAAAALLTLALAALCCELPAGCCLDAVFVRSVIEEEGEALAGFCEGEPPCGCDC